MSVTRVHITIALMLAAGVWASVLWAQGIYISRAHATPFGIVVGFLALVAIAVEHYLWRLRWLHGWVFSRPDLRGTWEVELQSSYVDPITKQQIAPIKCYMGVTQTFSKLQLHLMTPESESWLVAHSITRSPSEDGYQIFGVYTNKPDVHLRSNRSEMHFGALVLHTHGSSQVRPSSVSGEYFTDRLTKGSLLLSNRIDKHETRYSDAVAALNRNPS